MKFRLQQESEQEARKELQAANERQAAKGRDEKAKIATEANRCSCSRQDGYHNNFYCGCGQKNVCCAKNGSEREN